MLKMELSRGKREDLRGGHGCSEEKQRVGVKEEADNLL